MDKVLQYLKKHGQRMDSEITEATGIPRDELLVLLKDLSERGEISTCSVTRFNEGHSTTGVQCRLAGSIPVSSPGRKPGATP